MLEMSTVINTFLHGRNASRHVRIQILLHFKSEVFFWLNLEDSIDVSFAVFTISQSCVFLTVELINKYGIWKLNLGVILCIL